MLNNLNLILLLFMYFLMEKDSKIESFFLINLLVILMYAFKMDNFICIIISGYLFIRNHLTVKTKNRYFLFSLVICFVLFIGQRNSAEIIFCLICCGVQSIFTHVGTMLSNLEKNKQFEDTVSKKLHELENLKIASTLFDSFNENYVSIAQLNSLLNQYKSTFYQQHFSVKWIIEDIDLPVSSHDAVSLICNILDNILIHGKEDILFQCTKNENKVVILAKNKINPEKDTGVLDQFHGHGTQIIKKIVKNYQGELFISENDNNYSLMILFDDLSQNKLVSHKQ